MCRVTHVKGGGVGPMSVKRPDSPPLRGFHVVRALGRPDEPCSETSITAPNPSRGADGASTTPSDALESYLFAPQGKAEPTQQGD
ncbi:hypothetical protein GCM10009799_35880 [Nocardiopsis rhodophaea]|uniref:Uncharacterized protein n=1 Tax=Nocardiopsis rhodophaea TaxID=280238 RepID=A0ABP5EUP7_9ACTN